MIASLARANAWAKAGAAVFALASAFTALAWLLPGFDVAYGGEGMHIAVEAVEATVCLVVGGLAWLRYSRAQRLDELLVAIAVGLVLVVENAFLLALPTLLNYEQLRPFSVWSSTATAVLAAGLLLAAALAGATRAGRRRSLVIVVGVVLLLAVAAGLALLYEPRLPLGLDPALSPVGVGRRAFVGQPAVLAAYAAAGVLLLLAAVKILVSVREDRGPLPGWLGLALLAGGVSSLNYTLFPSLYSYWVYAGDVLQLAFCVLLAGGIVAELRAAARRAIEIAVLEERRRLARDLHDGLAQELALIVGEIAEVPAEAHPALPWIRSAGERALFESRRAIAALTLPLDEPLTSAIAAAAEDVTSRAGAALRLEIDDGVRVDAAEQEAILRVVREATMNAVRHGSASTVHVTLEGVGSQLVRLEVSDDGIGLDPDAARRGFGLTSMTERIGATGGELRLTSTPGAGTTLEARWAHRPLRRLEPRGHRWIRGRRLQSSPRSRE
jgi:signal transduction histidine kinase